MLRPIIALRHDCVEWLPLRRCLVSLPLAMNLYFAHEVYTTVPSRSIGIITSHGRETIMRPPFSIRHLFVIVLMCTATLAACASSPAATSVSPTPAQAAIVSASTSEPTSIPNPTSTLKPTNAPKPTRTPTPTQTPTTTPPPRVIVGTWSSEPPLLTPRSAHAVASNVDAIYAVAGTDDKGNPVLSVERFNGKSWSVETRLPGQGLNAPSASIIGDRLYVVGGFEVLSNTPTNEVLIYDLKTKKWSKAAPLPNPRGGHAAVVAEGKLHVFGGGNSESTIADHSMYDPATDKWVDLAPLPRSEGSPAAVVVGKQIYVIGGRSGYHDYGDVYVFDLETGQWSMAAPIQPRGTSGAAFYCGGIFLFGGESQSQASNLDDVLRYDLDRQVWEGVTPLTSPRKFVRSVIFNNAVYLVGGSARVAQSHSSPGSAVVEKFVVGGCQ